ncbi:MAG TPA: 5-oxoprolinase subunit PxpB [Methylomirabilota bacterium]|jgi:KipI family sensor histidine kinase inhibitor|nr:5-oxoprolinase subunit PxpB [Methylomirabilota bacterium]
MIYAEPRVLPAGDLAVSVELADEISREANARVRTLERLLAEARLPGIVETVPTFRSLLVSYDPLVLGWEDLLGHLQALVPRLAAAAPPPGRRVELPCAYGGEHGPDLEEVARRLGLAPDEVVRLHAGAEYFVYFVGFTPGLPYMTGMPERLTIPRLDRPRTKTPPGSVGIGGSQCSIYSVESPGGFWVLGRTPLALYAPASAEPILLRAGDRVRFRPIDADEFRAIADAVAAGTYRPRIEPERAEATA